MAGEPAPYVAAMREQGLLALSAGGNVLRLLPPLIATAGDLKRSVEILRSRSFGRELRARFAAGSAKQAGAFAWRIVVDGYERFMTFVPNDRSGRSPQLRQPGTARRMGEVPPAGCDRGRARTGRL